MRAVVQRVINASVAVDGQTISQIGKGIMVLVGIERNDTPDDAAWIIKKVLGAKLWDDDTGAWKRSVVELDGEVLCVSQFTLYANFKGLKPDFHQSMSTLPGKALYTEFLDKIRAAYSPAKIQDGQFGAMMAVSLTNDGPVTMLFDSHDRKPSKSGGSGSGTSSATSSRAATPAGTPGAQTPRAAPLTEEERKAIGKAKIAARVGKKEAYLAKIAAGELPPPRPKGASAEATAEANGKAEGEGEGEAAKVGTQ